MMFLASSRCSVRLAVGLLLSVACGHAYEPEPPVWPGRFHALLYQNRSGDLGVTDLWYDYPGGQNLNVIQEQSGEEDGPLYDNERSNGSTYYYLPAKAKARYCSVIDFDVGILKPDWLKGATFLGEEKVGIYDCYKWEQGEPPDASFRSLGYDGHGWSAITINTSEHPDIDATLDEGPFITYWSDRRTGRPVKWVFFDDAEFEVIRFDEGATMHPEMFQIPAYCFEDDDGGSTGVDALPLADATGLEERGR